MSRRVERAQILEDARQLRADIEQMFTDAAYWNAHVRRPDEARIDPDPDGEMRRIADSIDQMLADDPGYGPLAEIAVPRRDGGSRA